MKKFLVGLLVGIVVIVTCGWAVGTARRNKAVKEQQRAVQAARAAEAAAAQAPAH